MSIKVKIDDFGRILIPKNIRDHLGLTQEVTIKIEEKGGGTLIMRVVHDKPILEESDGVLVFKGSTTDEAADIIQELREERTKKLIGDSK